MKKYLSIVFLIILNVSCYKTDIDENTSQLNSLSSEINQLKSEVLRLSNLLNESENKVSSLRSEITTLKNQIDSLNSSLDNLEDEIQLLGSDLTEFTDLLESFDDYLKEIQSSFDSIVSINQGSLDNLNDLIVNINRNVEIIDYVSSYLKSLTDFQVIISSQSDKGVSEINSLITDLKTLLSEFNSVRNITDSDELEISLLGHVKVNSLLKDIDFFEWGEEMVPGVITADCNWVRVFSDSRDKLVVSLHPSSNTLLMSHHSPSLSKYISASNNNNILFFKNFYKSPKKILYVSGFSFNENRILIDSLKNEGHIIDFVRINKNQFGLSDVPQLSKESLESYGAIYYDDFIGRPSEDILNNLKSFAENPIKSSIFVGIGWVWSGYRSVETGEPYPINKVFESMGAKFNDWSDSVSFNIQLKSVYYPQTYNENSVKCE